MAFKRKFPRVHPHDIEVFSPLHLAVLIGVGWMTDWPHSWTPDGWRRVRSASYGDRGYDGLQVINEACWLINSAGIGITGPSKEPSPAARSNPRLRNLNSDYKDREAID